MITYHKCRNLLTQRLLPLKRTRTHKTHFTKKTKKTKKTQKKESI